MIETELEFKCKEIKSGPEASAEPWAGGTKGTEAGGCLASLSPAAGLS